MKFFTLIIILISVCKILYSSDLFETNYYEVNFVSNDIENYKIQKINEIKTKSLLNIFEKTLTIEEYKKIANILDEDLINSFIKNILIDDEKIINDKYFSKIKINFDKNKIINYFREKKLSYVEYYPEKLLLIIYEDDQLNKNLFTDNNKFYSYLKKNSYNNVLFKVPNLDINDRYILNKDDVLNKDIEKIKNFSKKYKLDEVMIVVAIIDNGKVIYDLFLYSDNEIIEKRLDYNKLNYKKFFQILNEETLNIWKKINQVQNNFLNILSCNVKYFNMLELKEIRINLNNISTIQNLNLKSLSYKNIVYDIYYYGNFNTFNHLLNLNNLKINSYANSCEISLK